MLHRDSQEKQVLIVTGHSLVAIAITFILSKIDCRIRTTAHSCSAEITEVLQLGDWFRIFIDIDDLKGQGLSIVRYFARQRAHDRCVIVTESNKPQWIVAAKGMGLRGYILKSLSSSEFMNAIQSVVEGSSVFPEVLQRKGSQPPSNLTRRQHDVLFLLHRGYSSKQIAAQLGLSTGTVDNHVAGLMRALNVSRRSHAITKGMELGYIITFQDFPSFSE